MGSNLLQEGETFAGYGIQGAANSAQNNPFSFLSGIFGSGLFNRGGGGGGGATAMPWLVNGVAP
ncbi:MAG TPA: hypothetical protein VGZ02_09915 [Candidatus Baltobacteraceae bacterium]|nr:hypothetical protein [Candidatus Baltobacteraceae bacterium]